MQHPIEFRLLSWEDLEQFLKVESRKINNDVDKEVRYLPFVLYCEQTVEGLYLNGQLVGFARYDRRRNHLSNLYVAQEARGKGVAKKYLQEREFESLYVMPHNHQAKQLYASQGFQIQGRTMPTRDFMVRPKRKTA